MCKLRLSSCLVVLGTLFVGPQAARPNFIDFYAPENWFTNLNGGCGAVDTSGAPGSVALTSTNCFVEFLLPTEFTIIARSEGYWSFDWSFVNNDEDICCEDAGYLLNGIYTMLAGSESTEVGSAPDKSGSTLIEIPYGATIGYSARSLDGRGGSGVLTISNFSGPNLPEPSTLSLFVLGATGLVGLLARRGKTRVR